MTAIMPPAILKSGRVPKWDQKKCIMCYRCAELCPYEAVNFKINLVKGKNNINSRRELKKWIESRI